MAQIKRHDQSAVVQCLNDHTILEGEAEAPAVAGASTDKAIVAEAPAVSAGGRACLLAGSGAAWTDGQECRFTWYGRYAHEASRRRRVAVMNQTEARNLPSRVHAPARYCAVGTGRTNRRRTLACERRSPLTQARNSEYRAASPLG